MKHQERKKGKKPLEKRRRLREYISTVCLWQRPTDGRPSKRAISHPIPPRTSRSLPARVKVRYRTPCIVTVLDYA